MMVKIFEGKRRTLGRSLIGLDKKSNRFLFVDVYVNGTFQCTISEVVVTKPVEKIDFYEIR